MSWVREPSFWQKFPSSADLSRSTTFMGAVKHHPDWTFEGQDEGGFSLGLEGSTNKLVLSLGSANHDEALFESPESFDIHRKNARAHIAFGRGIHFCLGNRLAIEEATIALQTLTDRVPTLDLVQDQTLTYFPNFTFRGPKELWLTWSD